jgi:hypothetical protein
MSSLHGTLEAEVSDYLGNHLDISRNKMCRPEHVLASNPDCKYLALNQGSMRKPVGFLVL